MISSKSGIRQLCLSSVQSMNCKRATAFEKYGGNNEHIDSGWQGYIRTFVVVVFDRRRGYGLSKQEIPQSIWHKATINQIHNLIMDLISLTVTWQPAQSERRGHKPIVYYSFYQAFTTQPYLDKNNANSEKIHFKAWYSPCQVMSFSFPSWVDFIPNNHSTLKMFSSRRQQFWLVFHH